MPKATEVKESEPTLEEQVERLNSLKGRLHAADSVMEGMLAIFNHKETHYSLKVGETQEMMEELAELLNSDIEILQKEIGDE